VHPRAEFFATQQWAGGVIGMGYVGLPLAVAMTKRGLTAIGYDISQSHVAALNAGESSIEDVTDEELQIALASGLTITSDPVDLGRADAVFIAVPSPLGRHREPDLSYIKSAAETISTIVRPGMLVALESTTYPGTTEDILVPAATAGGLVLDEDVFIAFSPERVSPGDDLKTIDIPKVVGGVSSVSSEVASEAYKRIVTSVHTVSSARTAEMAKLLENTYRAVNIGLVNEMAQLADKLDIDIWETIDAAATKPFGYQAFYPGPGVGGHCIPLDPQFLAWRAREAKFSTRFIDLAEQVNVGMPAYTADRAAAVLNRLERPVFGTEVLGVGIAYKPDIADDRESASIEVLRELEKRGARISVIDPVVGKERVESHGFTFVDPDADLSVFSLAVVLTDHRVLDLADIATQVEAVLDTRGAFRKLGTIPDNVEVL